MDQEEIKFEITLLAEYWDKPPIAKIYINDVCKWDGDLSNGSNTITFKDTLNFTEHTLRIERSNKTDGQHQSDEKTQLLSLEKLVIDGVNIRDIVWTYSWYEPEYPRLWALMQKKQGNVLEEKILAETNWGHNGNWYLNFTSPVYMHIINWMNRALDAVI